MSKKALLLLIIAIVLISCDEYPEIDPSDFPQTNIELYISGNNIEFDRNTKAIDVYNTVIYIFPDDEVWHDISNGEWKRIMTDNTDGLTNQSWETILFYKVKHKRETKPHYDNSGFTYTHTVSLYTSDSSIRDIIYEWKTFNGNKQKIELKNDTINGDIKFTF
jgi:hypothetical protein